MRTTKTEEFRLCSFDTCRWDNPTQTSVEILDTLLPRTKPKKQQQRDTLRERVAESPVQDNFCLFILCISSRSRTLPPGSRKGMGTIVKDMPPLIPKSEGRLPVTTPTTPETAGGGIPTSTASPSSSPLLLADLIRPHGVVGGGGGGQEEDSSSPLRVAALSNPWEYNALQKNCSNCRVEFNAIIRRHHCRLCGKIFCNNCSDQRALIPPSSIVLTPDGGKHVSPRGGENNNNDMISFSPDPDPDRMLSYLDENQQLLYGKGLEERFQLAREPLRVCGACWELLQPVQEELRNSNSNAMRFNHIDPNDPKRFLNSPLAFTLGHEVRKAAYALNNLLPSPKRMGSVIEYTQTRDIFLTGEAREIQQCHEECRTVTPNLSNLDGVKIPARLLEDAKGIAVMTVAKGGFGLAGVEFGTGLVVARLGEHQWSAPCAIGTMGVSWGGKMMVSFFSCIYCFYLPRENNRKDGLVFFSESCVFLPDR